MEGAGVSRRSEAGQIPQTGVGSGTSPLSSRASPPGAYLAERTGALRAGAAGPWGRAAAAGRGSAPQPGQGRRGLHCSGEPRPSRPRHLLRTGAGAAAGLRRAAPGAGTWPGPGPAPPARL